MQLDVPKSRIDSICQVLDNPRHAVEILYLRHILCKTEGRNDQMDGYKVGNAIEYADGGMNSCASLPKN